MHQQCADDTGDDVAGRAEDPRIRNIHVGDVRADHRRAHEAERRQLRDAREEPVLEPVVAGVIERIDAPRIDGAVAESRADTVDALGDDEHVIMMRHEIQQERADPERRAEHVRPAASEEIGEGSRRHVGQKEDDEVRRQHAVDLELVQAARMQKDGIDAEEETAGERVQPPHRVVAARDVANGRSMRSRDIHRTSPRNFPRLVLRRQSKNTPKSKSPGARKRPGLFRAKYQCPSQFRRTFIELGTRRTSLLGFMYDRIFLRRTTSQASNKRSRSVLRIARIA